MNYLLYGDLHLREDRLEDCMNSLGQIKNIALKYREELEELRVVNLGDTFENRSVIHTSCIDALSDEWNDWKKSGIKQDILVGNHDQADKEGKVHGLKAFKGEGWNVVDKPLLLNGVYYFPFAETQTIEGWIKEAKIKQYAFVHWPINTRVVPDKHAVDHVLLSKKFGRIFSGHYHMVHSFENIHYVGSPFQHSFGEMGQKKGVLLVTDKGNEFIELDSPKHYEVVITWEKGKRKVQKPKGITEKDFVRFRLVGDEEKVSRVKGDDLKKIVKCRSFKTEREVITKSHSRLNIKTTEVNNIEDLMEKYVDHVETDLDKSILLEVGKEIVNAVS